ncbi:hypothetical protein MLD38_032674 [Melastoma candidum]|uniref:Uncharacterized protein n=1 Tax=Melastoma candidum TaxID=119954 RepID=A0ACB9M6J9_9MYRT|nr:hypothetical protein MLD38_032674 [Melastoma candidum]
MSNMEEEGEPMVEEEEGEDGEEEEEEELVEDEDQQENGAANQSGCGGGDQSQEWEAMAGAWLRAFPEAREVNATEVESWIDCNRSFLPSELKSMERSELIERLLSIQNILRIPPDHPPPPNPPSPSPPLPQEKAPRHMNYPPARFQRTDLWLPVYSWLESLKTDEVVNSSDITEWLANNLDIREQLSSKHSKYHLTHYIKKCHMKILKRREKLKGKEKPLQAIPLSVGKVVPPKLPALPAPNAFANIPKDGDLYQLKRNEAFRKYEILVAFEKQLLAIFPRHVNNQM